MADVDVVKNGADFSISTDSSFTPSGLLSEDPFVPSGLLSEDPFVPNGLLASGASALDRTVPTAQVQDEIPPSFSDSVSSRRENEQTPSMIATSSAGASLSPAPRGSIRATTFDGKTVVLQRKRKVSPKKDASTSSFERAGNLLDVPMHRLMEDLSAATAAKLAFTEGQHNPPDARDARPKPPEDKLWVDRYRPQRFLDLLGDERVHRETLSWVKEWDFCVFGRRKPKGKQRGIADDSEPQYGPEDEYRRPRERILLLSGPPGLGKTTLAHVVGAQAGYQVMEINASDARSGQVVDDRIRPALESGAAVGSKKPVLLVVDEIDGATGGGDNTSGFVQKLLQLTFDKPKRKARANQPRPRPLLRPIIAICNDLYSSSLARLRQHARIIRFNRPPDVRLVKRLRDICEVEGMRADSRALSALVGIAQGDMRGCLNTLQFIKSKKQDVTEPVIRAATVGMKETDASLLSVLGDLFTPLPKRRARELGLTEAQEAKYTTRLSRDLESSGSLDKVAIGCFEHYLNLRVHDATFQRYEDAHEWLSTFDMLSGTMRSEREYALMPYLPYTIVPFFPLFAERGGPKIERPRADWENYTMTRTNTEICSSLAKASGPGVTKNAVDYRHLTMGNVMTLEFLPLLNRIISPPLRPVNSQLVRPEERALLKRLVDIMVSLQLKFVQERAEDGSLVYRLDLPIDVFITYDGKRAPDVSLSRYAVRHMVAAEIDAELIVRQAEIVDRGSTNKIDFFKRKAAELSQEGEDGGKLSGKRSIPQKRKPQEEKVDPADKPPTDFFGRPIALPETTNSQGVPLERVTEKCKVIYRFKEGNSSAVRKPVKVGAML
ncbi:P-loop containing nucleoside triphosphate hydrolase protein [Gautieria morchelliformis]|nr:P-loop containing nucleoside triphosphate hydrolase protein [Gautieria morchelliformis]